MPLRIDYESRNFPAAGAVSNGFNDLATSWDELLWAAITVGRPDWFHVIRYGDPALYEAIFRWSMIRMALEQSGPNAFRLRRTAAARMLDPTEKGAVNYFIGMTICKLFASKLLQAPWMLHVDVFGPALQAMRSGRSRPDLIGQIHGANNWVVMESKGRGSIPNADAKRKAKEQSGRITSISGVAPSFQIGAITFLSGEVIRFYWEDPMPPNEGRRQSEFQIESSADVWGYYYRPALAFMRSMESTRPLGNSEAGPIPDLKVSIHPAVTEPLFREDWTAAREICFKMSDEFVNDGYQRDGLSVKAGQSWLVPFKSLETF